MAEQPAEKLYSGEQDNAPRGFYETAVEFKGVLLFFYY
jgi:hypothetical protein